MSSHIFSLSPSYYATLQSYARDIWVPNCKVIPHLMVVVTGNWVHAIEKAYSGDVLTMLLAHYYQPVHCHQFSVVEWCSDTYKNIITHCVMFLNKAFQCLYTMFSHTHNTHTLYNIQTDHILTTCTFTAIYTTYSRLSLGNCFICS